MEKMKNILLSPTISKNEKFDFIISLIEKPDEKFKNFVKILVLNDRMNLIPAICDELRYELSVKENRFIGHIISNSQIDKKSVSSIEEKLSSKFDSKIVLETIKSDYPGIKIEIEDLGVEISFSIDRLKAQMTEHILKAI
jgi:F-type H+-transporting ATPase subunit delta